MTDSTAGVREIVPAGRWDRTAGPIVVGYSSDVTDPGLSHHPATLKLRGGPDAIRYATVVIVTRRLQLLSGSAVSPRRGHELQPEGHSMDSSEFAVTTRFPYMGIRYGHRVTIRTDRGQEITGTAIREELHDGRPGGSWSRMTGRAGPFWPP